jgi:hypothetical protein
MMILRALLPKHWVMQGWNTGLAMVGTMACFGSLYLGMKVVARTPPAAIQEMTQRSAPQPARTPAKPSAPAPKAVLVKPKGMESSTAALAGED